MKFLASLFSSRRRKEDSRSDLPVILTTVLACFVILSSVPFSGAADDQTTKAVRRTSPDGTKKVALVIGNKDYKDAPLRNSVNDAEDLSSVLKRLGFTVITKTNVNKKDFEEAIDQFAREMRDAQIAFFYFSGHGCEAKGENYLVPVNDTFKDAADLNYKAVKAGFVLEKMEDANEENKNSNRINIVILDACRNNPFKGVRSSSRGLTEMRAPAGSFIAYATAPGTVAADGDERNGVYTKQLLRAIESNGVSEQAFKVAARKVYEETKGQQRPWISFDIVPDFFSNSLEKPKPEDAQELAKLRESERLAKLEKERLEKANRDREQEIAKLREAEKMAALEKERLEREKLAREREQEVAKLREAQRTAALEKERFEKQKRGREQEIVRLREAQRLAALEKERIEKLAPRALPPKPAVIEPKPGDYYVNGTNPNGTTYSGTVTIRRQGDKYVLVWKINRQTFYGEGTFSGERLNINWGPVKGKPTGLVTYRLAENNVLRGTWSNGQGAETLTPK